MIKRIAALLCLSLFCMTMLSPYAYAATPLDPDADASLTLHYQKDEHAFSDLSIRIYRVAEAFADGTFQLIDPYSSYPINIHDITMQQQWKNTAATLSSYIVANQLKPYREGRTNDEGTVAFLHLETGLYLVSEVKVENDSGSYVFNQFMVYLPTPQADGSFDYSVEANPKCIQYVPKTEYRVTKLWQDTGNQSDRPEQVTVEIYKDGALQETQILSADTNWSYTWTVSGEDRSRWTVVESAVPEVYTITVQQSGGCFTIINTHKANEEPQPPPRTGDTFNYLPYVLTMSISGVLMIMLSVYGRRKKGV